MMPNCAKDGLTGQEGLRKMPRLRTSLAAQGTISCRATPAGGAPKGGWGRTGSAAIAALACSLMPVLAEPVPVPSGAAVSWFEYLSEDEGEGPLLRARYVAPHLNGADDIDAIWSDLAYLCDSDAARAAQTMEPAPARIVVSLSSEPLTFGEINADVVQYFEAFRLENGRCIWEVF